MRTTPSVVAFSDTERLVGEGAVNQCAMNPKNTIFEARGVCVEGTGACGVPASERHPTDAPNTSFRSVRRPSV